MVTIANALLCIFASVVLLAGPVAGSDGVKALPLKKLWSLVVTDNDSRLAMETIMKTFSGYVDMLNAQLVRKQLEGTGVVPDPLSEEELVRFTMRSASTIALNISYIPVEAHRNELIKYFIEAEEGFGIEVRNFYLSLGD